MATMQNAEITLDEAIQQAPRAARELHTLAKQAVEKSERPQTPHIYRYWINSAGTYCYHTHIAISGQTRERLEWATTLFYNAAELEQQPWYPQFLGGYCRPCPALPAAGIEAHQFCLGRFDLGLGTPRAYRQLVSLNRPDAETAVIVARSVAEGHDIPQSTRLAYTLTPNGEVLHWDGDHLHWHHICCTPGAALFAQPLDRYFINFLRWLRIDGAERKTYREEAIQFSAWIQRQDHHDAV